MLQIPIMPAPRDSEWKLKKRTNELLTNEEAEQYYVDMWEIDYQKIEASTMCKNIPSEEDLHWIIEQNEKNKNRCMSSHTHCDTYNRRVLLGVFEGCGAMDPFKEWKKRVNEEDFGELVFLLMDQFDYPELSPTPSKRGTRAVNLYYQAKYGMFACIESYHRRGTIPLDSSFVYHWERNAYKRRRNYYGALAHAVASQSLALEDLEPWRRDYRQGRR